MGPYQPRQLFELLDKSRSFASRLKKRRSIVFDHVSAPAQPFVAAHAIHALNQPRVWVVCQHVKVQETLHHDLNVWGVKSSFMPEVEFSGFEDALPDPDITAERLKILHALGKTSEKAKSKRGKKDGEEEEPLVIVLCEESLEDSVPTARSLKDNRLDLRLGGKLDMAAFAEELSEAGYERVPQIFQRGQFAIRGGIVDVYSWQNTVPSRIELFDDEIESIRQFDVDEQTSIRRVDSAVVLLNRAEVNEHCLLKEYIEKDDVVIGIECPDLKSQVSISSGAIGNKKQEDFATACFDHPLGAFGAGDFILQEAKRDQFLRQMDEWKEQGWQVAMFFNSEGELERFSELVDADYVNTGAIQPYFGRLGSGFTVPSAKLAVLADAEIFGRYQNLRARRLADRRSRKPASGRGETDYRQFEEGDIVVHQDYGIGRFQEIGWKDNEEVLVLEYAEKSKLYVPLDQAHLVSRYIGSGKASPKLSALGDKKWARTRDKAEQSIMDYAEQLLAVQADRTTQKAYSHSPDTKWQWEFENSFLYKETPDQLKAIDESKHDMESEVPMDRLVCGDVGFGKTEVAIRAAFKAVMSGKQVAILVPTTVLAQQHYQNFRERMSDFPVKIDMLSRYRTAAEQRQTVANVANGSVDIVVGTHRLISQDISFKNLGLVVIDEEQRFGVRHKERFKELFRMVDVLTLSATPIPRTLYLSLMGVKDMSTIDTPPANRIPVSTTICPYDERVMRTALERELKRQGQVFFLHNRVKTIHGVKKKIEELCPGARVEVGHGQMEEGQLEDVMTRFVNHEFDVLVSTTIIESGIDIPNANTIIIDRADRFGLADLYQLRGRVGRAQNKAYAILMIPRDLMTEGDARRRINAIKQYTALGSGFKIAMRDLEIRGAGNLLGTQQSGHIAAVGFDLYCRLLRKSVAKLRGERTPGTMEISVDIDFLCTGESDYAKHPTGRLPAFIPADYMEEARHRITSYRELAELTTLKELNATIQNWEDRFGRRPESVDNLLRCAELKVRAAQKHINTCEIKGDKLILTRNGEYIQIDGKYPRLKAHDLKDRLFEAIDLVKTM